MRSPLIVCIQVLLHLFAGSVTSSGDHVAIVQCPWHADCQHRINDELIAVIEANMNNESAPCVNFWDYACGKWTAAPYYDHVDNFGAASNLYAQQMQQVLTGSAIEAERTLPHVMPKLQAYYDACNRAGNYYVELHKYVDELGAATLNVSAILAGDASRHFDWLHAIAELRTYGINGIFFEESVAVAFNDSKLYVLDLKLPTAAAPLPNSQQFVQNLVDFGWLDESKASERQIRVMQSVYEFSVQLRELQAKHKDDEEEPLLLKDLLVVVPNIDWHSYFKRILPDYNDNVRVQVASRSYLRDLANFLAQSDEGTICFYILMRVCDHVKQMAPQITPKNCALHTSLMFPLAMNYIYNRWVYRTRQRDERILLEIFESLKRQFEKYLQANKLHLKSSQINYLQEKLNKMQLRLGNLPTNSQFDVVYYDRYYDGVNISATNFFANHWEMLRFRSSEQHEKLLESSGRLDLVTYYVNDDIDQLRTAPYFVHQRNLLIVPLIFVQMPFFNHALSPLLQYSLMGWILGHELNHGFEMEGITVDGNGIESATGQSISEWPPFKAAVECLKSRPTASVVERIADVNGFQLAYDTYFATQRTTPHLGDVPFQPRQLFFLNFAQFFCGNLPRAVQHDRDDVRVLEVVRHSKAFAEAFNCNAWAGAAEQRCEMWRL